MSRTTVYILLFITNLFLHLTLHFIRIESPSLHSDWLFTLGIGISKQLVVIFALCVLLSSKTKAINRKWIIGGLILGWIGDLFLYLYDNSNTLFSQENIDLLFLGGLGFFLLGHIFYVIGFWKDSLLKIETKNSSLSGSNKRYIGIGLLAYASTIFIILKPYLGEMLIPVLLYIVTISLMFWFTILRPKHLKNFKLIILGALFFVLSDSILAFDLFRPFSDFSPIFIMLFYGLAQLIIAYAYTFSEQSFD